jgi:hypothetical protein
MPELLGLLLLVVALYVFVWLLLLKPAWLAYQNDRWGWIVAMVFFGWIAGGIYLIVHGTSKPEDELT